MQKVLNFELAKDCYNTVVNEICKGIQYSLQVVINLIIQIVSEIKEFGGF